MFEMTRRRAKPQNRELLQTVLKRLNPDWTAEILDWDMKKERMEIGGRHLLELASKKPLSESYNVLMKLKIKDLIISVPDFINLQQLSRLNCTSLDLSKTSVEDFSSLKEFQLLNKLIISNKQMKYLTPESREKLIIEIR